MTNEEIMDWLAKIDRRVSALARERSGFDPDMSIKLKVRRACFTCEHWSSSDPSLHPQQQEGSCSRYPSVNETHGMYCCGEWQEHEVTT